MANVVQQRTISKNHRIWVVFNSLLVSLTLKHQQRQETRQIMYLSTSISKNHHIRVIFAIVCVKSAMELKQLHYTIKLAQKNYLLRFITQKYTIKTSKAAFQCKFDGGVVQTQTMAGN